MTERFSVHNVDTGHKLRPNHFGNPAAALAYGYAWIQQESQLCPVHGPGRRIRKPQDVPWCGCADFVVRDDHGQPLSARRCINLALGLKRAVA